MFIDPIWQATETFHDSTHRLIIGTGWSQNQKETFPLKGGGLE